jgi:hypothetical protein
MSKKNILIILGMMLFCYYLLSGTIFMYPVKILVAFLHELGHALCALLTGGTVHSLQVNPDGSGVTTTSGGSHSIILIGGYLGSCIFGNLLFYLGSKSQFIANRLLVALSISMVLSSLIWFGTVESTVVQIVFAVSLFVASRFGFGSIVVMFLGIATTLYVIQDFDVGPSSDLNAYEKEVGIFSSNIWKYVWLVLAILVTALNVRLMYSKKD